MAETSSVSVETPTWVGKPVWVDLGHLRPGGGARVLLEAVRMGHPGPPRSAVRRICDGGGRRRLGGRHRTEDDARGAHGLVRLHRDDRLGRACGARGGGRRHGGGSADDGGGSGSIGRLPGPVRRLHLLVGAHLDGGVLDGRREHVRLGRTQRAWNRQGSAVLQDGLRLGSGDRFAGSGRFGVHAVPDRRPDRGRGIGDEPDGAAPGAELLDGLLPGSRSGRVVQDGDREPARRRCCRRWTTRVGGSRS